MSKIVQAVNTIILNQKKITEVTRGRSGTQTFFLYDDKYVWSIAESDGEYILWFYPKGELSILADYEGFEWDEVPMVRYSTGELGTREAKATFAELYSVIKEKVYGVDDVLNDIIEQDIPF